MIKRIVSTELPIDEQFRIRKNVIQHGRKNGLRFCVVTGTHGDELEGQMVCYELARIASEHIEALDGTLEIYPALNPLGIDTIQRGIPNFDLDMNRIFPGDPNGTMAEQTAHAIVEDIKGADMVIMGMWHDAGDTALPKSIICKGDHVTFLNAETSGVFLTELKCGINVSQGQVIGQIVDPLRGIVRSTVTSPVDGYLFTIRAYPIVYEGSLMARIFRSEK